MKTTEFRLSPDGEVYYQESGQQEKRFTLRCLDVIDSIMNTLEEQFPTCFDTLKKMYLVKNGKPATVMKCNFNLVNRFIRCNFGEHDLLAYDYDGGSFRFEEVKCPLRGGLCKHENIICKPRQSLKLSASERQIASFYVTGMTSDKIATAIGKNPNTVRAILHHMKNKLKVERSRDMIAILQKSSY